MSKQQWLAAVAVALAAGGGAARGAMPGAGGEAPDFVLKSVRGENLRLSEYRGEVVMLCFWASWCGDCRAQLEELGRLHGRYRDAGVELLAVSLDQSVRPAEQHAAAVTYPVLHDVGGAVGRVYGVERVPAMVLIDRAGVVREVFEGYRRGNDQRYLERVQALLKE